MLFHRPTTQQLLVTQVSTILEPLNKHLQWEQQLTPIIQALRKLRQEDYCSKSEANLGFMVNSL